MPFSPFTGHSPAIHRHPCPQVQLLLLSKVYIRIRASRLIVLGCSLCSLQWIWIFKYDEYVFSAWIARKIILVNSTHDLYNSRLSLIVYLIFFLLICHPTGEFSLIWRAANTTLITIELWRFFSVPHLLWQGISVYNGHQHF